jgi:hypothetical protein
LNYYFFLEILGNEVAETNCPMSLKKNLPTLIPMIIRLNQTITSLFMCALVIAGGGRKIDVKKSGNWCSVPNDPYIKLCYYLHCVHRTSIPESIPSSLISWESRYRGTKRTTDDLREIMYWVERYSPGTMKQEGYFVMVTDGTLTGLNAFFRVTATSTQVRLLATNEAALGLLRRSSGSVTIMLYEERW